MCARTLALGLWWCSLAAGAQAEEALNIGPLRFGMTIEEVPRELPGNAWRELARSPYTGTITAIRLAGTFEVAGMPFLAEIRDRKAGEYQLRYVREWSAENARECRSAAASLIEFLEPIAGPFAAKARVGITKAGNASTMSARAEAYGHTPFFGRGDPAHLFVESRARISTGQPVEFEVRAQYERLNHGRCGLEVTATRAPPVRAPERYPFAWERVVGTVSASSRNRTLRENPDLPAGGRTFTFDCKVRRGDGKVDFCKTTREEDRQLGPAFHDALWQAMAIRLDVKGYDPDDPLDLDVQIPIHLNPTDLRSPDFSRTCALDAAKVPWIHAPRQFAGDYPDRARQRGIKAKIDVGCEVQGDGSLICALAPGATPPPDPQLLEKALLVVERGEVARELDGRATAGCLLRQAVTFPKPDAD